MNTAVAETTSALDFEIDHEEEYGRFFLNDRREVLFYLNLLTKRGNLVTAYIDNGEAFFLTSIVGVDEATNKLFLDAAQAEHFNKLATHAQRITLVTTHERVKMQIRINRTQPAQFGAHPALATLLPSRMLRLQRREYFRLEPPLSAPIYCQFIATDEQEQQKEFNLTLADISGGGVSLIAPPGNSDFFPRDGLLHECRLDIPGEGVISVTLCVRKAIEFSSQNGQHSLRIGCEFLNLRGNHLTQIQRYITRIERERKANFS